LVGPQGESGSPEVGTVWPVADDVEFTAVDVNGMPGEYSIVPWQRFFSRADVFSTAAATVPVQSRAIVVW
jgi:hypothetical protein